MAHIPEELVPSLRLLPSEEIWTDSRNTAANSPHIRPERPVGFPGYNPDYVDPRAMYLPPFDQWDSDVPLLVGGRAPRSGPYSDRSTSENAPPPAEDFQRRS